MDQERSDENESGSLAASTAPRKASAAARVRGVEINTPLCLDSILQQSCIELVSALTRMVLAVCAFPQFLHLLIGESGELKERSFLHAWPSLLFRLALQKGNLIRDMQENNSSSFAFLPIHSTTDKLSPLRLTNCYEHSILDDKFTLPSPYLLVRRRRLGHEQLNPAAAPVCFSPFPVKYQLPFFNSRTSSRGRLVVRPKCQARSGLSTQPPNDTILRSRCLHPQNSLALIR